jgi:hypothetical protein
MSWESLFRMFSARLVQGGAWALVLASGTLVFEAAAADIEPAPVVAALHVHSTASTGSLSFDEIAEEAERLGVEAVIFSDNFALRFEYGLAPLRGVLRKTVSFPSVLEYGTEQYLEELAAAQARHPRVLLIPGVEVAPHYFWTGSLFEQNLTMHDGQKNLLVLGLNRPEDYADLPVHGNTDSYHYGWGTVFDLTPLLLLLPAAWLWPRQRGRQDAATKHGAISRTVKRVAALALGALAVVMVALAWPFSQPAFSPYEDLKYRPHQTLIDAATDRGATVVWSMPEARDFHVQSVGPVGSLTIKTEPYLEALEQTTGYAGFGGVYEDNRSVARPGGTWDQVIAHYLAGRRTRPPFVTGEIAFHGPGHDHKRLNQVQTVLWVHERTQAGVLQAIQAGRMYAVHQHKDDFELRLETFRLECETGLCSAESGETITRKGPQGLEVVIAVSATDQRTQPITLTVIKSGRVLTQISGETPFETRIADPESLSDLSAWYRILVKGGAEIVSNPIFVQPRQAA